MQTIQRKHFATGIFVGLGLLATGSAASGAMVLPAGTSYQVPAGGTLVVNELYGSNNDGQGSWTSFDDPNITVNPESITVVIDPDNPNNNDVFRSLVTLPFDIHTTSYVIDVGLEYWACNDTAPSFSLLWLPASTSGTKYNYITQPATTDPNDPTATLRGKTMGGPIDFDRDIPQVVRFTATAGTDPVPENYAVVSLNPATTTALKEGAAGLSGLFLTAGGGGAGPTTLEVSWMKIYTGVVDNSAPLGLGLEGDLDGDGFVGITDLNLVLSNWNLNVPPADAAADPTGDDYIGIEDLNVVLGNWNAGTPPGAAVPEPASLALLGLGGLAMLRCRTA